MPQAISIPPLIPLPNNNSTNVNDDKDDIFSTLFSPATPRGSPTTQSVQELHARPQVRHTRTSSIDSEFGSFVSVPSSEDPLHHLDQDFTNTPFTPLKTADFFDRFAEDAKAATQKNREQVLTELLQYEADPTAFLRTGTHIFNGATDAMNLTGYQPRLYCPIRLLSLGSHSPGLIPELEQSLRTVNYLEQPLRLQIPCLIPLR